MLSIGRVLKDTVTPQGQSRLSRQKQKSVMPKESKNSESKTTVSGFPENTTKISGYPMEVVSIEWKRTVEARGPHLNMVQGVALMLSGCGIWCHMVFTCPQPPGGVGACLLTLVFEEPGYAS